MAFCLPQLSQIHFLNWETWGRQKAKWLFTYPNSPKFTFFNFVLFRITVSTSLKDLGSTLNIILHFIQKPFCKNKRQIWCLHSSLNTYLILVYVDFLNKILKILSSCKHCEMRSQSWRFFDTASVTSSKHVLFGAQSIANIRILSFHRSSTLKFLKYFWTHSFLNFGQPHGVIISVQPIKGRAEKWWEIYFSQYFLLFVLKACVW